MSAPPTPTTAAAAPAPSEPFLRTLVPALRNLERHVRDWLEGPHSQPLSAINRAALEGLAADLGRQADALGMDRPLLVIMLMGGTGVGKSTLLNALASGAIAQASFTRPTTRDPVVYYHESLKPDRLDPALRHCRLAPHDRPALEQKILVDTPDLDSNDLSNREKLLRLLPVADVVLYVGSQEKYHDRLGWELFLQQRKRRAFAFVLNKWDRCLYPGASGVRPDEDLLRDLREEGFQSPLLFRTCAQLWVDRVGGNGAPAVPEGEQFPELVRWLEAGLNRLEIEAIKARGVGQLLTHLEHTLDRICPPDLTEPAAKTRGAWERLLGEEASATAEILLNTLEPYQREIEHHFALESQRRFRGLMASYMKLFTRTRYVGSSLRDHLPFLPRGPKVETPATWNLSEFTQSCTSVAGERHLDARGKALANRLLVEANQQGFPLPVLTPPVETAAKIDWRQRYSQVLIGVMDQVEQQWARPPAGWRGWCQGALVWLANRLPLAALFGVIVLMLWQYTVAEPRRQPALGDLLLPLFVVIAVLVLLHIMISVFLPIRWPAMRGEFQRLLERQLRDEMNGVYLPIPRDVAEGLLEERRRVQQIRAETDEVARWVEQREQSASIAGLYGE